MRCSATVGTYSPYSSPLPLLPPSVDLTLEIHCPSSEKTFINSTLIIELFSDACPCCCFVWVVTRHIVGAGVDIKDCHYAREAPGLVRTSHHTSHCWRYKRLPLHTGNSPVSEDKKKLNLNNREDSKNDVSNYWKHVCYLAMIDFKRTQFTDKLTYFAFRTSWQPPEKMLHLQLLTSLLNKGYS